jgi:hypothetical protein
MDGGIRRRDASAASMPYFKCVYYKYLQKADGEGADPD